MSGLRRSSTPNTRAFVARHLKRRLGRALAAIRSGKLMPADLAPDLQEHVLEAQAKAAARRAQQAGG